MTITHGAATALDNLPRPEPGTIVVCTLGGVADIGMNLTLYGAEDGWLLVDAGTMFAPRETVGVEAIMPDPRFLTALGGRLKGLVVSHYHEDHVGAITRYWPAFTKSPIFAPPFAARMLTGKFQDKGLRGAVKIKTFEPGTTLGVGPFRVRTVRVAHSTPDCVALAIETKRLRIVQTNDWKIDENPGIGSRTDLGAFRGLGRQGVDLMLCDSTNADREAPPTSEASVRRALEAVMRETRGMVFVCSFGSNVARMASVAQAAKATRRKVALAGRSLRDAAAAAEALGLMKGVPRFLEDASKLGGTQRNGCAMMCTGTQGEENASLAKLAGGRDPRLPKVLPGDTIVMSARAIPGNETYILEVTDKLRDLGARIVTSEDRFGDDTVHVTGHPVRADLRVMYEAVKPRFAIPVHGSPTHLAAHATLADELGVEGVVTPVNGGVYALSETGLANLGRLPNRLVAVLGDGAGTMVPWDDGAKVALLTEGDRQRLEDHAERERIKGEQRRRRIADEGATRRSKGDGSGRADVKARDGQDRGSKDRGAKDRGSKDRGIKDRNERGAGARAAREPAPVRGAQTRPFETVAARPTRLLRSDAPRTVSGQRGSKAATGRLDTEKPAVSPGKVAKPAPEPRARKSKGPPGALDRSFIELMSKGNV